MTEQSKGTHEYRDDPRNAAILIDINGEHFARNEARVSVFDSGFVLGDGVWEGLRVHHGRVAFLDQHLERQALFQRQRIHVSQRHQHR